MALFKISKGQSSSLPKTYNDGYCYVTTDDGKMYIDTTNTSAGRIVLNAGKADKLAQARKIELAGDATGSVNFDGSSNVKINVTIKASNGIIIDDKTNTIKHSNTITEGTASEGGTSRTLEFGSSFNIPGVTYDAQGHITGKTGISLTLPPNPNTDTRYNLSGVLNSSGQYVITLDPTSGEDSFATVPKMIGATSTTAGTGGLVPAATSANRNKYLRGDGTWATPTNTNTTYTFATGSTNGTIKVTPSNGTATNVAVKGLGPVAYTDADVNKGISIASGKIGVNVDRGISISDDGNIGHANAVGASTGTIQMTRNSSAATFNLPTIKWDAHGHIVSYKSSAYTLDANTSTSAGVIPACSSPNYVWATNANGVPGWRSRTFDSSDTWHKNTATQEGVVAAGTGNANKVWKTDAKGNPGWRDDANTWVLNDATTSGIVAAGTGNANKVWKTDAKGVPAWRNDADTATYPTINRITSSDWRPILMGATSITPGTSVSSFSGKTLYQNENVLINSSSKAILAQSYRFVDATGAIQPMMLYNDSNIWIGATKTGGGHFKGGVCISTGYNGKKGNPTINISIPNSANTGATNYKVLHSKGGEDGGLMNGPLFLQDTGITKGTKPKDTDGQYIGFFDKTGIAASARTGMLYSYVTSGGQSCMKMYAYQFKSGSSANTSLYVAYNADGTKTAGTDAKFYGAVWNDYAEFRRQEEKIEPGYCVTSKDDGKVHKTTKKFEHCEGVVSDTFGFAIGQTEECQTPLAVAGRVLVYCDGDRYDYHAGDVVCAGPEGKVYKMTDEEICKYPHRIVGTVSEIPEYEIWGEENISVNRRIWINVK